MKADQTYSQAISAGSTGAAPESSPARINTALEALNQFPSLLEESESCGHRRGEHSMDRRLPTPLLSPSMVEQLMQLGGDGELLIEPNTATPTSVRVSTLARLILRNVSAGPGWKRDTKTISGTPSADVSSLSRSYQHVPWVIEVMQLRAQMFGAVAANDSMATPKDEWSAGALDAPRVVKPTQPDLVELVPKASARARRAVALTPPAGLDARLAALAPNTKENSSHAALKRLKERLYRTPPECRQATIAALDALARDFPNFLPLIDQYRSELQLKRLLKAPLVLRPTLLVGPPGIGKTAFMRRLCSTLNLHHLQCAVATVTAAWVLNGKHNGWRGGTAGLVAEGVLALPEGQGLMLQLDELDKMPRNLENFPVEPVLLELLEPISRQCFKDEFLELPLNLMPFLSVLATANQLQTISAPLISRFQVVRVEAPTKDQMPAVVRSVDQMMRQSEPGLAKVFASLTDEVKAALGTLPPRQVYQVLEGAYGCAAARSQIGARRVAVTVVDVAISLRRLGEGKANQAQPSQGKAVKGDEVDAFMVIRLRGDGNPEGGSGSGSGGGNGTRLH